MKVGLTTTIPVEVLVAAGKTPVDLNNVFITSPDPNAFLEVAERAGYPRSVCAWIKGIYGVVVQSPDINTVIAVTQGDCSNTHALMETLELEGIEVIPFAYPYDRHRGLLKLQIEQLMERFGVSWPEVKEAKKELDCIREKVWLIDELTYTTGQVTGEENHLYQVSCSDFMGDPWSFAEKVEEFLQEAKERPPAKIGVRLGFIGVPPIFTDLYSYLEERGARVVFNEVQRQFTMPFQTDDLVEQYLLYTYPYGIFPRLEDIKREIERRRIQGLIHYTQSFCFRQIEDLIVRRCLKIPILSLEGDRPGPLDARTRIRLDAFLEMLSSA
ncbi:2-hydroxyglutaryl-CoA dehydratase D-component [Ammonifex degensii KC4]|uniref:2-hydroxyglutaryl-CoA dehydratase D-component n=1 Tax=Ammonifex degensii (strain DSM 10501 / KC4) TaxID=429009 RepID=C9RBK4_AMMDK|nr:2-hydroxyacyl-CoA dehydratase [Ammonifex degensii]ACX51631.1 2-hydroxyglutaryl-CoA dehydratase D-component [Ammonifex degensii KC4]